MKPPSSETLRWWMCAAAAVSAHGAAAGAFLVSIPFTARPPEPAAMAVELAELPIAPPAPPQEIAPGPDMVEAPETPPEPKPKVKEPPFEPPPELDLPNLDPEVVLMKQPEDKPFELPSELPPAPATLAQASMEFQSDRKLAAPNTGGIAKANADAEMVWEGRVLAELEALKRYPPQAQRQGQQDVVYLRFVIDRKGVVLFSRIERSRGYALLDSEVRDLIRRASPLPPLPDEIRGETVELTVPVEFFIRRLRS